MSTFFAQQRHQAILRQQERQQRMQQQLEQKTYPPLLLNVETGLFDHDVSMSQSACGIELLTADDMTYQPVVQFQEFWNSGANYISTNLGIYQRQGKTVVYKPKIGNYFGSTIYFTVDPFSS